MTVVNSDATPHNTNVQPRANSAWNISQPPGAGPIVKQFNLAEAFIPFKCNQHPWERAYLGVFAHPFFAVSSMDGSYKIEGLPPGTYTLVAWHERFGAKEVTVTIAPGERKSLDFAYELTDGR